MDVGELLSFKPTPTPKRPNEEDSGDSDDEGPKASKMRRMARNKSDNVLLPLSKTLPKEPTITDEEREDILRFVENETTEGDVLDETAVKKLVLNFEKKTLRNREMRIKFPDQPEKFMDSEIDLYEALQELSAVATVPDQYPLLVDLKCINSLLELLSHDNTDVSTKVVHLLQASNSYSELTDDDILQESEEGAEALMNALAEAEAPSLLLHNLSRLDEQVPDERDAVHDTLGIIENLIEFRTEMCAEVAKQGFLQWILKRLKFYKRNDPAGAEEQEAMENMFNSLCCALTEPSNRDRFLRGEGLQLMNLMLREKKMSRNGSLKVLDYALAGPEGRDNCNKFVDILGLRTVFPLFMKTPKRKRILTVDEHEEHVVSIIASMLRNCQGSQRQRLLAKFTENDLEKVDRLLELHFKYMDKVDRTEKEMEQEQEELNDDAQYLMRLSNGLFTLQLIDRIILEASLYRGTSGHKAACTTCAVPTWRLSQDYSTRHESVTLAYSLLDEKRKVYLAPSAKQKHSSPHKKVRVYFSEYAGNLGDAGSEEWRQQEQQHILQLVDKF
ncbi:hypothetical protein SFRURICE_000850 [Spodoptera frugiperda]|nr:hypothetical protein SFRURICE_000850 [Spodoptera frugiperda]